MVVLDEDGNAFGEDYAYVFHFRSWLAVLSSPRILKSMRRVPTREHLLFLLDAFLPYARSTRRRAGSDDLRPDPQAREARTLELRAMIERWTGSEISREITQAARALLREDDEVASDEEWDAYEETLDFPPEDYLCWPEGVPLKLREQAKQG